MNSRKVSFILLLLSVIIRISAQDYLAYNNIENTEKTKAVAKKTESPTVAENEYTWKFLSAIPALIDNRMIERANKHDFGQRVACLKTLMDKYYITKEDVIPGDPMMRTIVLKPNVYYTVRKIEKHLKKEVKNGDLTAQEASAELEHVLEVALSVIDNEDDSSFERALQKSKKNIENQLALFLQVKLQNIYR